MTFTDEKISDLPRQKGLLAKCYEYDKITAFVKLVADCAGNDWKKVNYHIHQKKFTPKQLRLIVATLGRPLKMVDKQGRYVDTP